jgi:VWFA-related protein
MKIRAFAAGFVATLLALVVSGAPLVAQESPAPQPENPYTLHVYANRIQLPTIVIDASGQQVRSLRRDNFDITLDGGTVFHPSAARVAGDDPITLALLLDVSGMGKDIYKHLPELFGALAPDFLHPKDHISVFAVDCHIVRTLDDVPADPAVLKLGIGKAFTAPGLHGKLNAPACGDSIHLWDAIATVANNLSSKPGRRVMLVVSPGREFSSKYSFEQVAAYTAASGIAVFGMRDREELKHGSSTPAGQTGVIDTTIHASVSLTDLFEKMCRENGGVVLNVAHTRLAQHLQEFINLLRARYIIEYPRPDEPKPGKHTILISVHGSSDIVLPTGASTPLPDPAIASDPTTVPSAPSPATFGKKQPPK